MVKQALFRTYSLLGGDRLAWALRPGALRILCYHGLCDDALAKNPWVPDYFVTQSAFDAQLGYLRQRAHVLPLAEAFVRLRDGSLPPRAVSITFDDGYANNLTLAYPVLQKYGLPATIFLSTAYIESGDLFPFLKLKLIRLSGYVDANERRQYKTSPLDHIVQRINERWPEVGKSLTADQLRTLRPMTPDEVRATDPQLIEFGAHTHTHCILGNESRERREQEIRSSIDKVERWTGRPVRLFAYPNGERGDYGEMDKEVLRSRGIQAAVTATAGANNRWCEPFELKRYPVGLYHDSADFRAEVTGFRTAVLRTSMGLGL
jgi:peptidoglycan/xylan/chitin deacetylase (PgdA/CDA1 family)